MAPPACRTTPEHLKTTGIERYTRAMLNIIEDFASEKERAEDNQRAMLNILEDFDTERTKANATAGELREAFDSLRRAKDAADAANHELEAFSYSVSHDLRAPLRHIQGFAELLLKSASTGLDEKCTRYLRTISKSANQLGTLIDDLLVFSRMGRSEMTRTKVSIEKVVKEAKSELQDITAGRDIRWNIGRLPEVNADPTLLKLVFVNLISNAVKFTRLSSPAMIEVGCDTRRHDEAVFFVKDNGVGFDMQYVDKLFGVFQRLHRPEEFEGTGIGLANVRRIVHRHGGKTWAEGEVGEGATVYFSLPKT